LEVAPLNPVFEKGCLNDVEPQKNILYRLSILQKQ
jgi:hypothetical protein